MLAHAHSHRQTKRLLRFFSSLRFRLMLWYLLILGIVLCTFSAAIYFTEEHTLYQSLDTVLDATMEQLASSYDPQLGLQGNNTSDALVILPDVGQRGDRLRHGRSTADRPYHSRGPAGPEVPCRIDGPQGRSGLPFRGGDRQAGDDRSA